MFKVKRALSVGKGLSEDKHSCLVCAQSVSAALSANMRARERMTLRLTVVAVHQSLSSPFSHVVMIHCESSLTF